MLQPVVRGREPAMSGYEESPVSGDSLLDLHELRGVLRRRKKTAIAAFVLTVLAALIYILVVPPTFVATSLILSDPRQERVVQSEAVLPGIGSDAAAVESQVELLSSTELIRRVMNKLGLFSDPEFARPSFLSQIRESLLGAKPKQPDQEENEALERFRKRLDVSRRGLTYVLEVGFTSFDAAKSAKIANAIADTYLEDQITQKKQATTGAEEWLKSRIDELREKVNQSERAVADFKAEYGIVELGGTEQADRRLDRQQLDQINQELINARAEVAAATAKVDQMKRLVANAGDLEEVSAVQGSPIIQELRKQYAQIVGLESNYAQTFGPQHPTLLRVRSQMARIKSEIINEAKRILAAAINEQETARKKEAALTASLADYTKQLEANDRVAVQLSELERQAEADNTLYTQFLARTKEVGEQEGMQKPDARIIARAVSPTKPKGPGKVVLMALATAAGLLMALLAAFAAEKLDNTYRTRGQLEDGLGIACVALCPLFRRASFWRTSKTKRAFKESIHLLRNEIQTADPGKQPIVVLVSSARPGEGKSTIASALADSASRSGQRSLLIDADSKTRSLSRKLAPTARHGLFDVLRGDVSVEEALIDRSKLTKVLPMARADGDALGALTCSRLAAIWQNANIFYDLVIIDGPPVLSSVEPLMVQDCADIILLVVEWGRTSREDVMAAADILARGRGAALGAVLNKVDPRALQSSNV